MKILDCTLRDGGYYTNWDFDQELAISYYKLLKTLPIDIIEIGYRGNTALVYFVTTCVETCRQGGMCVLTVPLSPVAPSHPTPLPLYSSLPLLLSSSTISPPLPPPCPPPPGKLRSTSSSPFPPSLEVRDLGRQPFPREAVVGPSFPEHLPLQPAPSISGPPPSRLEKLPVEEPLPGR